MIDFKNLVDYLKDNNIVLDKPIVFFDLETTGTNVLEDKIIEFAAIKVNPDYSTDKYATLINPERHIPDEASSVNSICDDDVKDKPKFAEVAQVILDFMKGCDVGGYNVMSFDIPFLIEELNRVGLKFRYSNRRIVDAFKILIKAEPRDLSHIYENFTGKPMENAHAAYDDSLASAEIAFRQMGKYNLPTVQELAAYGTEGMVDASGFFKRDKNNTIVFAIGKYKGRSVVDVYNNANDSYYFENYIKAKCNSDINNHLKLILEGIEK